MKIRFVLAPLAALAAALMSVAPAQADQGWVIKSFHSDIQVTADGTLKVNEDIRVDFGSQHHHGIYRYIPIRYSYDAKHDRYYRISVKSVTDGLKFLHYTVNEENTDEVITIGDPNVLVTGQYRYFITYEVSGVLNSFSDHDELYWNVDGGNWPVAKQSVSATVSFPAGALQKSACYQGPAGSVESCTANAAATTVTYATTRALQEGEQMSIVTGLKTGAVTVAPPLLEAKERTFPQDAFDINPGTVGVSLLIFLAGLALIVRYFLLHARDRAYRTQYYLTGDPSEGAAPMFRHDAVVVEFAPPQNLRPAELGLLLDERADAKDVTATIVDLAVRGVLTITQVTGKTNDWTLTWKPNQVGELLPFEKTLLDALFTGREAVKVSELRGTFRPTLTTAESQMYQDAMSRKWFTSRPDYLRAWSIVLGFVLIVGGGFLAYSLGQAYGWGLVGAAIALLGMVLVAIFPFMSVRTAAGRDLMQHTLGFRLYMTTAEKYRQQFAEKAEIFTQLLPYAIVFGCVTRWAKAFEGIDTSQTNGWYVGPGPFQAALLAGSLESMNAGISTAVGATPGGSGGSGFGGGGFSGGGGGGGGGGAW